MKAYASYYEIENLCEALIKDFMKRKHYTNSQCVDIEAFVTEYLGIPIVYASFDEPDPGRIGFFSDGITPLCIRQGMNRVKKIFPKDTVVIEEYLKRPEEIGRHRFTIAHEGAHYVLGKHIPMQSAAAFHSNFDGETEYSIDLLKAMMSLNESFVNRAGAVFLMPQFLVLRVLRRFNNNQPVLCYDNYVLPQDQKFIMQKMADAMGVNYSALFTRLKELSLFDIHPIEEYLASEFYRGGAIQ